MERNRFGDAIRGERLCRTEFLHPYQKTGIFSLLGKRVPHARFRALCLKHSWIVTREYVDVEPGRKGKRERAEFAELFRDGGRRRFDLVLFWSLDRFSREGITKTIAYMQQLNAAGVKFKSLTEPFLNSDNELVAHILLGVLSHFAQLEATKISRRTKAGLERLQGQDKTVGRPDGFTLHGPLFEDEGQGLLAGAHEPRDRTGDQHRQGVFETARCPVGWRLGTDSRHSRRGCALQQA